MSNYLISFRLVNSKSNKIHDSILCVVQIYVILQRDIEKRWFQCALKKFYWKNDQSPLGKILHDD